ncbi:MAG: hypothetical protein ACXV4B_09100 [Halobacteriota archaeon]
MEPLRTYRTLYRCDTDLDPKAHVHLLLARMARDLEPLHEWPDLSTTQAAASTGAANGRYLLGFSRTHDVGTRPSPAAVA